VPREAVLGFKPYPSIIKGVNGLLPAAIRQLGLPNFGTAIRWLSERGVKTSRLAWALGTNGEHIRVLRHRARPLLFNAPADSLEALLSRPTAPIRRRLKVRPDEDSVVQSRKQERRIEDLEREMDQMSETLGRSGEFASGLERLVGYDSRYGFPSSTMLLRFKARINQHRAWFCTHSGMSTSAFQYARIAMDLSHLAYREKEDPLDLRRLTEAALVASQASLLVANPEVALKILDVAASASERIADPLGSEHYRQRGTAHFQMLRPEDAADTHKYFKRAMEAMESKQECRNRAQLLMAGQRQIALLGAPDVDSASEILEQVRRDFALTSLEYGMMLNWTAACALATVSDDLKEYADQLLNESLVRSQTYGHQAGRACLLSLTTEVGLDRRYWRPWVYRSLYENALRAS